MLNCSPTGRRPENAAGATNSATRNLNAPETGSIGRNEAVESCTEQALIDGGKTANSAYPLRVRIRPPNAAQLRVDISRRAFVTSLASGVGWSFLGAGISSSVSNNIVSNTVDDKPILNFIDYGYCDGVTDDTPAMSEVLKTLALSGGGVLVLPPTSIALTLTSTTPTLKIPANVRIEGTEGATQISLMCHDPVVEPAFATTDGDNVSIAGIIVARTADFALTFVRPGSFRNLRIVNCLFDGRVDAFPSQYVHGICLDAPGAKSQITVEQSTFTNLWYGIFQSNATTWTVDGITVDSCTFTSNLCDDLCFNAPRAIMRNILVVDSLFRDNISTVPTAGFGVDFAHVIGGSVKNCHFENYHNEAIHVEDYSMYIDISADTSIKSCGTGAGGAIVVLTGSSDIVISAQIDQTSITNPNELYAITILAGGTSTTPGGRPEVPPSRVKISSPATIKCGRSYHGIYAENVSDLTIEASAITGTGSVTNGVWDEDTDRVGVYVDGTYTVTKTTGISGFMCGVRGPRGQTSPDTHGVVSGNIANCYIGVLWPESGTLNLGDASISNCVYPTAANG